MRAVKWQSPRVIFDQIIRRLPALVPMQLLAETATNHRNARLGLLARLPRRLIWMIQNTLCPNLCYLLWEEDRVLYKPQQNN